MPKRFQGGLGRKSDSPQSGRVNPIMRQKYVNLRHGACVYIIIMNPAEIICLTPIANHGRVKPIETQTNGVKNV